tara:strand:+ start:1267 stop:2103 length:837 start_codon:yes stop_codon:yes gene_type:complete
MPELPEVETTARLIRPDLVGRKVRDVNVEWTRTLGGQDPFAFTEALVGATIVTVDRRAKWVRIALERRGKPSGTVLVHLRMTGRLVVNPSREEAPDYARVSWRLDRGTLHFLDVRKFGRMEFFRDPAERLADLGPEPLGPDFTASWFRSALRGRSRALKPLLLDQTFLAGLGNIYVDESLFRAGLHPLRRSDRVPPRRADVLHAAIRDILAEAIEREGSSFDGFYRTPEGQPGGYQHLFQVYGREGQPCRVCERPLKRIVVGQRGTHFCTRCQPTPRS